MKLDRKVVGLTIMVLLLFISFIEVFYYDEFPITTNQRSHLPAVYEDIVVCQEYIHGNFDIYGYNLSKKQKFRITIETKIQTSPAIFGNIIVWQDSRNGNWDIYGYDLSTKKEFPISTHPSDQ